MNHTNMYYYTKIFISNEANRIQLNISLTLFNRKILLDSSEMLVVSTQHSFQIQLQSLVHQGCFKLPTFTSSCNSEYGLIFLWSMFPPYRNLFRSSRSQMFFKIIVLKAFAIFTGKQLCWSLFLSHFTKKRLQQSCFPVNIANFLITTFL